MREPEGFAEYVAGSSSRLLRSAWLLTGDWQHAEDLLQTALTKAYLHWPKVSSADSPDAYVRRILVTTYSTWWRRRWRHELPHDVMPESSYSDRSPAVDLRESVRLELAKLPRKQRAVVVLRYFDDLTEAETALALGCSVGTVKSQASKALTKLRASTSLGALVSEGRP